ncbi:MAG: GtrA family protein [Bacilli bacterium]|nr:GtrA family protein [Bacilli bacterium]
MISKIWKNDLFQQIFKFGIVGGIATVIDWAIYYIVVKFLNVPPLIGNILSFSVSVIYNYTASVKWVFHVNEEKSKKRMFIEFMVFSILGLLLTELLLWVGIDILGQDKMLVKIIATAIVMVFNFITRKLFLE